MTIAIISPMSPITSIIPLSLVLGISLIREGYEDWKRHKEDLATNQSIAHFYEGGILKDCFWKDLHLGQIIRINEGEAVPADIILVATSSPTNGCFLQTATLDGERALKSKNAIDQVALYYLPLHDKNTFKGLISCEEPNKDLYTYSGKMKIGEEYFYLNNKQLLLRGSMLSNTEWAEGVIVYSGMESKIMLNQEKGYYKRSYLESQLNKIVITHLIIHICILCVICMSLAWDWNTRHMEEREGKKEHYLFQGELNTKSPGEKAGLAYATFFLLLNTLVPISLIVSLETVKVIQALVISMDALMYSPEVDKQGKAISMTLHEELANISYVFADKTGTLTSNIMEFKACTVGGLCYDDNYHKNLIRFKQKLKRKGSLPNVQRKNSFVDRLGESAQVSRRSTEFEAHKLRHKFLYNQIGKNSKVKPRKSKSVILWEFSACSVILNELFKEEFSIPNVEMNLGMGTKVLLKKQNHYLEEFWLCLCLCHEVISCPDKDFPDLTTFQGTSPDEVTLLDAAKEIGFLFLNRSSNKIYFEVVGVRQEAELLQSFQFSSERKRMTVIVRHKNAIRVYCKGADNVIQDRLDNSIRQPFLSSTKRDVVKFAKTGYRTLFVGMRILAEKEYRIWAGKYEKEKLEMNNPFREKNMAALEDKIESKLFLLGATAVEDKLQKGVPEVISDLREAGINVWMLTGDKLETAENIGYACRLFEPNTEIIKILNLSYQQVKIDFENILSKIDKIKRGGYHRELPKAEQKALVENASLNDSHLSFQMQNSRNIISEIRARGHEKEEKEGKKGKKGKEEKYIENEDNPHPEEKQKIGLIISGDALAVVMKKDNNLQSEFLQIISECEALLVCRASPSQKAEVVNLVKHNMKGYTLAIGDGGNDVSMIKQAHVGIGIYGKEGYQAAACADYAIGQFRFLWNLLFIHGRWSGLRITYFLCFFFYKNIIFTFPQFWNGFVSGFSGQTYFDEFYCLMYNMIMTAIGVCAYAVAEQDIDPREEKHAAKLMPILYSQTRDTELFTFKMFSKWFLGGLAQSIIIYWAPVLLTGTQTLRADAKVEGSAKMGVASYTALVLVQFLTLALDTKYWNAITTILYLSMGILVYFPSFVIIYDKVPNRELSGNWVDLFLQYSTLHVLSITVLICIVPVLFHRFYLQIISPRLVHLLRAHLVDRYKKLMDIKRKATVTTSLKSPKNVDAEGNKLKGEFLNVVGEDVVISESSFSSMPKGGFSLEIIDPKISSINSEESSKAGNKFTRFRRMGSGLPPTLGPINKNTNAEITDTINKKNGADN